MATKNHEPLTEKECPCLGCEKRKAGCHDDCEGYAEYFISHQEFKRKIRERMWLADLTSKKPKPLRKRKEENK